MSASDLMSLQSIRKPCNHCEMHRLQFDFDNVGDRYKRSDIEVTLELLENYKQWTARDSE
jgi:hypothetical protein